MKFWMVAILGAMPIAAGVECSFRKDPEEFLARESRAYKAVHQRVSQYKVPFAKPRGAAAAIEPRNFIDDEIFGKLRAAGVASAGLATDEEYFRRVSLDFTGRLPKPDELRAFLDDPSPNKRDELADRLAYTSQFNDKWTMWLGDLLGNVSFPANFDRWEDGRNAFHYWIRKALGQDRSLKDLAYDLIVANGNTYDNEGGASNYPVSGKAAMGPIQDTYDLFLARTASIFLGMSHYDCLLCHNGRGHLDQISLWGSAVTRIEAQKMAAFFSRVNMPSRNVPSTDFFYRSFDVTERTTGGYDLNTNWGNRPDRVGIGTVKQFTPEYVGSHSGSGSGSRPAPAASNWRVAFAQELVNDRMLARNFANRLWKELFGLALVEPPDQLDPARLDPANPPAEPWSLQATHPELLEKLTDALIEKNYSVREFVKLLAQSNAYQLSSRYDGEWTLETVPLFARHYPRRLMAEEVHDAILLATGTTASYTIKNWANTAAWAMQLPEPAEPRSNGAVATFLNMFLRGNRDTQARSSDQSILQRMNLMNDNFVLSRVKTTASPALQAVGKIGDNGAMLEDLYLRFLSRKPTDAERRTGLEFMAGAKTTADRTAFIEDLAWALINKAEFMFSY